MMAPMIYALSAVLLIAIVALVVRERDHDTHVRALQEDWALERRELLNRIQHPRLVPLPRQEPPPPAPEQPRDAAMLAAIGGIVPGSLMEQLDDGD